MNRNRRKTISRKVHNVPIPRVRIGLVIAVFALGFLLLFGYSFKLQVLDHAKFRQMALARHLHKVKLRPNRGTIFDRNDEPLAVTVETDSVYVRPDKLENVRTAAQSLARVLDLEQAYVLRKFASTKPFVWIKRQIPFEEAARVRELDLPGIAMVKEADRSYPFGRLAAAVLGYTGVDLQGLAGIEFHYEKDLRGEGGVMTGERDALGNPLYPDGIVFQGTRKGASLRLTLDAKIQYFADAALAQAFTKTGAAAACVIVMNPFTGEILAMSSLPAFDPNVAYVHRRNIAVTDIYEPGSTFKPFAMAAAIEAGLIDLDAKVFCHNGAYRFGGHTLHDSHPYDYLTPSQIISKSSNIGITRIAVKLGRDRWHGAIKNFGFGQRTGVDFAGEPKGIVRDAKSWRRIDMGTTAFGQGVSVTPLQLLTGYCALVNGGNLMRPYLVGEVVGENGRVLKRTNPRILRRVISRKASRAITDMLIQVTQPGGTGTQAAVDGYTVAGKTGTAQKPENGRYSADRRVASFVGCVPAENPEIAVLVLIDDPKGSPHEKYGGVCAAPVFRKIAEPSLRYRQRFETERPVAEQIRIDLVQLESPGPIDRGPRSDASEVEGDEMPNLVGMSMRNVLRLAQKRSIDLTVIGSGVAVRQSPEPGAKLDDSRHGSVLFRPAS